jgi:hypothetical protein
MLTVWAGSKKEIAYWRERLRVTIEDLEDLESGKRKMAENKGEGWVDTTPHWIEKAKSDVAGLEELCV